MTAEAAFYLTFIAAVLLFLAGTTAVIENSRRGREWADRMLVRLFGIGGPEW